MGFPTPPSDGSCLMRIQMLAVNALANIAVSAQSEERKSKVILEQALLSSVSGAQQKFKLSLVLTKKFDHL